MRLIFHYIRKHLGIFLLSTLFLTMEAMADLLQPTFMSYIVDEGVKNADVRQILFYGAIMLGIALVGAVSAVMRNRFASPHVANRGQGTAARYVSQCAAAFPGKYRPVATRIHHHAHHQRCDPGAGIRQQHYAHHGQSAHHLRGRGSCSSCCKRPGRRQLSPPLWWWWAY